MSWHFPDGLKFRSLDTYPRKRTEAPIRAPFKTNWAGTIDLLARECGWLEAKDIYVLADCDATQLRTDGQLRAEARLKTQAVVLVIGSSKVGPIKLPCDRFLQWQDNVRAIALSLEALRKVDRYGVTQIGEQYRGWAALPPATRAIAAAEWATREQAMKFLIGVAVAPLVPSDFDVTTALNSEIVAAAWFRDASKRAHSDTGGSTDLMQRVLRARDMIQEKSA